MTLDLAMPGTGRDRRAAALQRRGEPPVPVVVVSAFSPAHGARAVDALAEGAFDLVAKPARPSRWRFEPSSADQGRRDQDRRRGGKLRRRVRRAAAPAAPRRRPPVRRAAPAARRATGAAPRSC